MSVREVREGDSYPESVMMCVQYAAILSLRVSVILRSGSVIREHMTVLSTSNHYFKLYS